MDASKTKILLIEDNLIAQKVAAIILKALNCDVDVANDGFEGLDLFSQHRYQLIFIDIGLPSIDGFTVAKKIRMAENDKKATPLVALSAHTELQYKDNCLAAGMNAYLAKPLTNQAAQQILETFNFHKKQLSYLTP